MQCPTNVYVDVCVPNGPHEAEHVAHVLQEPTQATEHKVCIEQVRRGVVRLRQSLTKSKSTQAGLTWTQERITILSPRRRRCTCRRRVTALYTRAGGSRRYGICLRLRTRPARLRTDTP
jgi:hypothetical protein